MAASRSTADRPNVLWIQTDEHVFDALGYADHPVVETPNIDRLADSGLVFERTYCPSPVCGPSRASLFTGMYPQAHGVTSNNSRFDAGVDLLPELLQEAGYHTALAGKLHFTPTAAPHGFEYERVHDAPYDCYDPEEPWQSDYVAWLAEERFDGDVSAVIERANADELSRISEDGRPDDPKRFFLGSNWRDRGEHSTDWVADESIEFLREHRQEPFFLFASFFSPHHQYLSGPPWDDMYDPENVSLPPSFDVPLDDKPIASGSATAERFETIGFSEDDYRELLAGYYGVISHVDDAVGRILDALDGEGLTEETVVIFTSDHGDYAGQFGWFTKGGMYENSVRVPLVVRDPAFPDSHGERTDRVVNNLGLFATVLERCGVDAPSTSSRSLVPLLADPDGPGWTDRTYSELGARTMAVDGDLKLLRDREGDRMVHELYEVDSGVGDTETRRPRDAENRWTNPPDTDARDALLARLDLMEERAAAGRPVTGRDAQSSSPG